MSLASLRRTQSLSNCRWMSCIVFQVILLQLHILAAELVIESTSEEINFTFLSNVNESKLHQNEYHVIDINISSKQASYIMHLSKPDDLFVPEHLGIHEAEVKHYECMFTGTITSSTGEGIGMASLSSCFHENAFEGLINLENEHYHITPSHRHKRSNGGSSSKISLKHKIAKPKASASNKGHRSDGKRVSKEELNKARIQMIQDQKSLEDEDDESEGVQDSNSINQMPLTMTDSENSSPIENTIETVFGARIQAKASAKNKKLARVIELAIFTDEAFYNKWRNMHPEDTVKKINQYVLALVNNMNYLYQQPSMGPKISFRLVNVGIQKNIPSGLKPSSIAERYLNSFCSFAGKKDTKGAIWDHAMMITSMPLRDSSGGDNLGIAFTSTMCLRYWSCSVVEYTKGFETAFTAAHELGHSLGMEHDGEEMNKKCNPSKFIMAAIAGSGQINWSKCSNKNIINFLKSGDPRAKVKDPSSTPRCLTKRGSKKDGIRYRTGKFPGKIFNVKKQCQQVCSECAPYIKNVAPYNDVCKTLHCKTSSGKIIPAHPALEGTACGQGSKKMCRNGKCQ